MNVEEEKVVSEGPHMGFPTVELTRRQWEMLYWWHAFHDFTPQRVH